MKNSLEKTIYLWAFLDIAYVVWIFDSAILAGHIPYYSSFIHDLASAESFGSAYPAALVVGTHLLKMSILLSGLMMAFKYKAGVYLSFIQAPFRFILVIPPTFFFIAKTGSSIPEAYFYLIVLVFILEVIKIIAQIKWLKQRV